MTDKSYKRIVLLVSVLGVIWTAFIMSSVDIALPYIGIDLEVISSRLSWISSANLLSVAIFSLPMGKVSDIIGNKKALFIGTVILTVFTFLAGISQSFAFLLFARIAQGIGCALINTTNLTIVFSAYPINERGKVLGGIIASTYIGQSLGPFISGIINTYTSWRGIFLVTIPIGLITMVLIFRILKVGKTPPAAEKRFDAAGTLLYGTSIFLIIFSVTNLVVSLQAKLLFLLAIILVFLFVKYEGRAKNPLIHVSLFKGNKPFSFSLLAVLITYSSTYAVSYLLSLYLQMVLGLAPGYAGTILLIRPAFQAMLSPFTGRLSDRVSPHILATSGIGILAVGLLSFILVSSNTPLIFIAAILSVIGIGFSFFTAPNTNAVLSSVNQTYYGVASGLISTARSMGQSLSMSITASVFSVFLGNIQTKDMPALSFMKVFKISFIVLGALCLIGVIASKKGGKKEEKTVPQH